MRDDRGRSRPNFRERDNKPSWKERDAQRGRPRDSQQAAAGAPSPHGYRAELEKLFSSGGIGKLVAEREKAAADGRDASALTLPSRDPLRPAPERTDSTPTSARGLDALARPMPAPPTRLSAAPVQVPKPEARRRTKGKKETAEPTRADLMEAVANAVGRDAITSAVDRYLADYPWPNDFEVLGQALDHRQEKRVFEALEMLDTLLQKQKPRRERALAARLRALEETSADADMRAKATRVRALLG